jgi:gluconolactonase
MKLREIAGGLGFPEGPVVLGDGSVLVVEIARGTLTRVTSDGKLQVVATLGGGPNGAAIGPDGAVYVCNNGGFEWTRDSNGYLRPVGQARDYSGGRIERVQLSTGHVERIYDQVDGLLLRGPNDLVFDQSGGFYFTDLGKIRADEIDRGAIFYARPDHRTVHALARPVTTPNGIALSPDGRVLYYAETEGARLWAFNLMEPGRAIREPWPSPQGAKMLAASPGGQWQRFDSMAVGSDGHICVATLLHGGISVFAPDGAFLRHVPLPDPFTTNICFGGADMCTAFITLSATGKLIAIDDWPSPGLPLHFSR